MAKRKSSSGPGWVSEFLARFDSLDVALVAAGFPATSPWWRDRIEKFLRSGRQRWVLRVGRRGGKSSTLSRLLVAWVLWGPWTIPPGDTAMVAIVSVDREEAAKRMVTVEAILAAIGVAHEKKTQAQEIHIPERRAAFAVKTCSLTGTIGFTSIAVFCDEQAKWQSKEGGANPANEVMATLRPTMATQPLAFEIDCSAPWGTDDYHAKLCDAGTTDAQVYDHAATWEAHPALTEERTRAMEPDEKEWRRAYGAVPSAALTGDWFGLALDRCAESPRVDESPLGWVRYLLALDVDFSREHLAYAVVSSRARRGDPRITRIHETGIRKLDGKKPAEVAQMVRDGVATRWDLVGRDGKATAIIDQEGMSFAEQARGAGLNLLVVPWSGGTKNTSETERYRAVRVAMREGGLLLPADSVELLRELRAVRKRDTATGNEIIELPRQKTEDGKPGPLCRVPAVVLAVSELLLRGAQPEATPKSPLTEDQADRERMVKEIVAKQRREWQKDPVGAMRRAMRMH